MRAHLTLVCICIVLLALAAPTTAASMCRVTSRKGQVPLSTPNAVASTPYWLGAVEHNGASPYNSNDSFVVYRNVKEYVPSHPLDSPFY